MSTYDLLMLAILGGLTLYGYFKGMAWQVAYIASFVVSFFVASRFADQVAPSITFVNPPVNKFVAMLLIYAVSSFFVWMIFRVVSRMIDSVKMEGFDHQMGALIGFARGVLWCVGVTFFAVTLLPATQKQQIIASRSGHYIARLLDKTDSLFPPEVHQVIGPYLDRLGNELNQGGANPATSAPPGWPGASAQNNSWQQPGGWSQSAPAASSPSSWPNSTTTSTWPTTTPSQQPSAWPATGSQAPAQPPAWPEPSAPALPAQAPTQPVSWPEWP